MDDPLTHKLDRPDTMPVDLEYSFGVRAELTIEEHTAWRIYFHNDDEMARLLIENEVLETEAQGYRDLLKNSQFMEGEKERRRGLLRTNLLETNNLRCQIQQIAQEWVKRAIEERSD